jgi:hypothetical protein
VGFVQVVQVSADWTRSFSSKAKKGGDSSCERERTELEDFITLGRG